MQEPFRRALLSLRRLTAEEQESIPFFKKFGSRIDQPGIGIDHGEKISEGKLPPL
jgi:hypothetical protein